MTMDYGRTAQARGAARLPYAVEFAAAAIEATAKGAAFLICSAAASLPVLTSAEAGLGVRLWGGIAAAVCIVAGCITLTTLWPARGRA